MEMRDRDDDNLKLGGFIDDSVCNTIAHQLNLRPRKRLGFKTPQECFYAN